MSTGPAASVTPTVVDIEVAPPPSAFAGRTIHFIGIGGCGMSGLARLLASLGARCRGSDSTPSDITAALAADGIPVDHDQVRGRLPDPCDLVIASAAIRPDHPEMLAAQQRGLPVHTYAEALGHVQAEHCGVSVAGTHGKSTTCAMLCHVLIQAGLDPSFIIGATCSAIGGGHRTGAARIPAGPLAGRAGLLVAEACEFNRSFHQHRPLIGLINNVEEDHLDIYGSLENVIAAFADFARLLPPASAGGHLVIAHDGAHRRAITAGLECDITTCGLSGDADFTVFLDPGARRVGLFQDGFPVTQWTNAMPGEHNALNSAAAAVLAHTLGADWDLIGGALSTFPGLDRRMQRLGVRGLASGGSVLVYDDYGHHPTEIEKTLKALRIAERPRRLICVFQPHQHSRTRFLLEEFARSFSSADVVIVPHIYFVRDSEIEKTKVSAADLVDRLRGRGVTAMHLYPFDAIVEQLDLLCRDGDLLVIMGAGPVWQVARDFLARDAAAADPGSKKGFTAEARGRGGED